MNRFLLSLALAATAVVAHAQSTGASQQLPTLRDRTQQPVPTSTLPGSDAVITVHGLCSAPSTDPGQCTTVITREQFEKLLDALNTTHQPVTLEQRKNLAQGYVEIMASAQAAQRAGMENDPKFVESMRVFRMRMLSDFYLLALADKYGTPTPEEIQDYYNQNRSKFEEITVLRVLIPTKNSAAANVQEFESKASQLAGAIHDRAVKGESFGVLQNEVFTTLGLTTPPPNIAMGPRRKSNSPSAEEQEIFALPVGGVSKVEPESGGYMIYKLESKQILVLDQVKDQVARLVSRTKIDEQKKAALSNVHADYNGEYFGPAAAPTTGAPTLQRPAPPK